MINYTPPTQHTSLFYNSEEEYLDIILPYIKAGLENNEFCIWIIPETLTVQDAQLHLSESMEDLEAYLKKEQLLIGDHKSFYLNDGVFLGNKTLATIIELEKKALAKGFKGVRGTGDCSWALDEHWFGFLMYEEKINQAIELRKIRALCSYYIPKLDLKKIYSLGASHQSSLVKQLGSWNRFDPVKFTRANIY
ncbi:MAG: hypothetical protein COV73_05515 [Candidatus Omnitrophica bacterium CG11_big_fil_rev_8_21_14_0_20_43_6]|nr:MAG: hypothetical protein COV73_05515 [Candidatus Omnitrophica bacterium CG11_big_fil_rev_8_21_14_0_20_43_6]